MADDYSRTWFDYVDDWDAEAANDLEARQEARVAAAGGGIELGYVETEDFAGAGNFTTTSTASTGVVVPDLSTTVVVGARPILIRVAADAWSSTATAGGGLILVQGSTNIGFICATYNPSSGFVQLLAMRRLNPAAGTYTYSLRGKNTNAGTLTVIAGDGTGTNNAPASIQVVEV